MDMFIRYALANTAMAVPKGYLDDARAACTIAIADSQTLFQNIKAESSMISRGAHYRALQNLIPILEQCKEVSKV
jgi:hypothetical protein